MIARLRGLAARPIHQVQRAFAVAALLLILATLALTATTTRPDHEQAARPATRAAASPPATVVPPAAPHGGAEDRAAAPGAALVKGVAREFLAGYLAALYGRSTVGEIDHTSRGLRRRLTRLRLRISPATRRRHPVIQRLEVTALRRGSRWRAVATIADGGVATYPIGLTLTRARHGVVVSGLLEDQ